MSIFDDIEGKYNKKIIQRDCKKLKKKFSINSSKDLGILTELIVLLYIFGGYEDAIGLYKFIAEVPFDGNYTVWTQIVNGRLTVARIYNENGEFEKALRILDGILPTMKPELYLNQKMCLELYDSNINDAIERKSKRDIISWSLIKFEMMIRFAEIPDFPLDKETLNYEIKQMKIELKEIIQ